ATKIDNLD
nr:Chain E, LEDGF peptide [Homo sapiens]3AVL_F Chain F, LEDGF peptide [Homo sapiens]